MKAFVTGSTGLLGSNLVRQLAQQGYAVRALARSKEKAARSFAGLDVEIVPGDLRDVGTFADALAGSDVLFHTAAYFREYYRPGDHWKELVSTNVDGTIRLLETAECHGIGRAIYVSSSGVIGGTPDGRPGDESSPPDAASMKNLYFRSKVLAEEAVEAFMAAHRIEVVQILPGWMFGPGDAAPTSAGQLVLDHLNRRLPALVPGALDVADARDVAQAMIAAVGRGRSGERYIVGGRYASLEEIQRTLERVSGVPAPSLQLPYPLAFGFAALAELASRLTGRAASASVNGLRSLNTGRRVSSAKAERELGATFRPLEETLRDTVAWMRANRPDQAGARRPAPAAR